MNQNIFTTEDEQGIADHMNDGHSSSLVHLIYLVRIQFKLENSMKNWKL